MSWALSHIGIAVKNIDAAIKSYRIICPDLKVSDRVKVPDQSLEVCFLDFPRHSGIGRIELLADTGDIGNGGVIAKFLEKRGEGLHHTCFTCENIEEKLVELERQGIELIDKVPRIGALGKKIAFIHPESTHGALIELEEE
ncbi:MAG: methylmalonyl-CoA epimerase [candidate division Zixibacteria bacterium]|nr:methylmalonyl-CoA epimerase [candidate division Zixibacteria bacterium]